MVAAPLASCQKPRKQRRAARPSPAFPAAASAVRRVRRGTAAYVARRPYQHLVTSFARDLQEASQGEAALVTMLHEASQAYLAGREVKLEPFTKYFLPFLRVI